MQRGQGALAFHHAGKVVDDAWQDHFSAKAVVELRNVLGKRFFTFLADLKANGFLTILDLLFTSQARLADQLADFREVTGELVNVLHFTKHLLLQQLDLAFSFAKRLAKRFTVSKVLVCDQWQLAINHSLLCRCLEYIKVACQR